MQILREKKSSGLQTNQRTHGKIDVKLARSAKARYGRGMRAFLHHHGRLRWAGTLIAALSALLLWACGGASPDTAKGNADRVKKVPAALEWRGGDEHSFTAHRADRQVIRCWNIQGKYDCLVAQSIGLKDVIPGAPIRLAFFRFHSNTLPTTQEQVDDLASSDGYACELTSLPGKTVMTESYWRSGRLAHTRASELGGDGGWTIADVESFGGEGHVSRPRAFFSCAAAIAPVLDVGLYALDSGLINYDQVFAAVDYPRDKPAPREAEATMQDDAGGRAAN